MTRTHIRAPAIMTACAHDAHIAHTRQYAICLARYYIARTSRVYCNLGPMGHCNFYTPQLIEIVDFLHYFQFNRGKHLHYFLNLIQ